MIERIEREQVKARKPHTCHMCGRPILIGAEHLLIKWTEDGAWHGVRRHIHCDVLMSAYEAGHADDGGMIDAADVRKWVREALCVDARRIEAGIEGFNCPNMQPQRCLRNPFACVYILRGIRNPALRRAAKRSVRENTEN